MDETLVADGIRASHVIDEDGAWIRTSVDVNDGLTALAMYVHIACGIDGTIEGVVAKLMGVETKEVVGFQVQVIAQLGEMLMVDASIDDGNMSIAVVNGIVPQENVVWDSVSLEFLEVILRVELCHVHLTCSLNVSH